MTQIGLKSVSLQAMINPNHGTIQIQSKLEMSVQLNGLKYKKKKEK